MIKSKVSLYRSRYDRYHIREEHRVNKKKEVKLAAEAPERNGPKDRQKWVLEMINQNLCIFICGCIRFYMNFLNRITKVFSRTLRSVEIIINSNNI